MSATDNLRRMLDERGVEHYDGTDRYTEWRFDGIEGHANATEWTVGGALIVCVAHPMTPEQAIEATLGRGECEVEYVSDWMGWHCKSCDMLWQGLRDQRPRYCQSCGRKVRA